MSIKKERRRQMAAAREVLRGAYYNTAPADFDAAEAAVKRLYQWYRSEYSDRSRKLEIIRTSSRRDLPRQVHSIYRENSEKGDKTRSFGVAFERAIKESMQRVINSYGYAYDRTVRDILTHDGPTYTHLENLFDTVYTVGDGDRSVFDFSLYSVQDTEIEKILYLIQVAHPEYDSWPKYQKQEYQLAKDLFTLLTSVDSVWMFRNNCILVDRAELRTLDNDSTNGLHNETGPMLKYRGDTEGYYYLFNDKVAPSIIEGTMNHRQIVSISDRRIAQVAIERYRIHECKEGENGIQKFIEDNDKMRRHTAMSHYMEHDRDVDSLGFPRRLLEIFTNGGNLLAVEVQNSSLEPDGTRRTYYLWVHPEIRPMRADGSLGRQQKRTCHNAVASTFGLTGNQYNLLVKET